MRAEPRVDHASATTLGSVQPHPLDDAAKRLRRPPGRPRKEQGAGANAASTPSPAPLSMRVREGVVPALCPRLLDLPGSADYLAVSVWTVRDMIAAGQLRPVRLPGAGGRELRRILLDVRDLDALVDRGKDR